eukprot:159500-Rhodomonas_salina.1
MFAVEPRIHVRRIYAMKNVNSPYPRVMEFHYGVNSPYVPGYLGKCAVPGPRQIMELEGAITRGYNLYGEFT